LQKKPYAPKPKFSVSRYQNEIITKNKKIEGLTGQLDKMHQKWAESNVKVIDQDKRLKTLFDKVKSMACKISKNIFKQHFYF